MAWLQIRLRRLGSPERNWDQGAESIQETTNQSLPSHTGALRDSVLRVDFVRPRWHYGDRTIYAVTAAERSRHIVVQASGLIPPAFCSPIDYPDPSVTLCTPGPDLTR